MAQPSYMEPAEPGDDTAIFWENTKKLGEACFGPTKFEKGKWFE